MDIKIKKYLETLKIKYQIIEHRKIYTAFNSAETQHVKTNEVIKTVLLKLSDGNFVMAAVPAGKKVDLKKIAKTLNEAALKQYKQALKNDKKIKKPKVLIVKLATEKDITTKLKTKVGLIAPFSEIYSIPLLLDKKLLKNKYVIISAGSYIESLKISMKDFLKTFSGIQGNFSA